MPQCYWQGHDWYRGDLHTHCPLSECALPSLLAPSCRFDRSLCIYEFDKLDKPREAFQRIRKCHTSAIVSMAYDASTNTVLTGSIDGSMKVWSVEGR